MKLLIDTNVILDMVFQRKGCDDSMKLFRKIKADGDAAYITASSVTDLFYIIHKELHDKERTYAVMGNILKLVTVLAVTENDIREALGQRWKDFEDCVQYIAGKNSGTDFIITVNKRDFEAASLPVKTPAEWLENADV